MKTKICAVVGALGSLTANLFGGWNSALTTLVIFMSVDYISGLIVAGVFHRSNKSNKGALESRAGWKGLARKAMTLAFVLIASRLDMIAGTSYIRDTVIIGFTANELISVVENAGLMGIPLPSIIIKALDRIKETGEKTRETLDK